MILLQLTLRCILTRTLHISKPGIIGFMTLGIFFLKARTNEYEALQKETQFPE